MSGQRPGGSDGECGGNAAPYVLGALTDAEHEAFVAHLATCAVCREEVAALQAVASSLPAAAPQLAAPAELKRRVMGEVRGEAPQREAASRAARPRRGRRPAWRPLLVPAALGVAVIVLLAIVLAGGGGGGTRVIRAEVTAPGASGSVRVSSGHAELTLSGMPQVRSGRVYELWVKREGAPQPTDALFTVSAGGRATVGVPGGVAGVRAVLVTSEPLGGSRRPTSAPVVVAQLG